MRPDSQYESMQYHMLDYTYNNNYDGLFEAVELAGVQSSDSIEDLFGQTSFEPYRTFDEAPVNSEAGHHNYGNSNHWQDHQNSWFDMI